VSSELVNGLLSVLPLVVILGAAVLVAWLVYEVQEAGWR
jgi:hypothetical protein